MKKNLFPDDHLVKKLFLLLSKWLKIAAKVSGHGVLKLKIYMINWRGACVDTVARSRCQAAIQNNNNHHDDDKMVQ